MSIIYSILDDDINNMLKSIVSKYGEIGNFNENSLSNYKLNKIVFYRVRLYNMSRKKNYIPPDNCRCISRIWGGKESVRKENGKWVYGYRCSRYKISPSNFCKLHSKKNPHGIYNLDPPHNHYEKYKFE